MSSNDLTPEKDFEATLENSRDLRSLQILHFAYTASVVLFGCVVLFLYFNEGPENDSINPEHIEGIEQELAGEPTDLSLLATLSIVHGVLAIGFVCAGFVIYRRILTGNLGRSMLSNPHVLQRADLNRPEVKFWILMRGASILRTTLFEGPALIGLVACLMGVMTKKIYSEPIYWLNAGYAVFFIFFIMGAFPTRNRIKKVYRESMDSGEEIY